MFCEYLRRLSPVVPLLAVLPILASCSTVSKFRGDSRNNGNHEGAGR